MLDRTWDRIHWRPKINAESVKRTLVMICHKVLRIFSKLRRRTKKCCLRILAFDTFRKVLNEFCSSIVTFFRQPHTHLKSRPNSNLQTQSCPYNFFEVLFSSIESISCHCSLSKNFETEYSVSNTQNYRFVPWIEYFL